MATLRGCRNLWCRGASAAAIRSEARPRASCLAGLSPSQLDQQRGKATAARGTSTNAARNRQKPGSTPKKKQGWKNFVAHDLKEMKQFALCDAMRYIRAFEVGSARNPKYELHVNLRTPKSGPVIRGRLRLPHPVKTDLQIAVICPPGKISDQAKLAGASVVGEDDIIALIKEGKYDFDRVISHADSIEKLNRAGVGRILGPRGLMPSVKTGTVVKDVAAAVRSIAGASEYREREGVIRLAIGAINFTPEMLQQNITKFMEQLKQKLADLSDDMSKEIHEVVLSSTTAPGFSLNGEFRSSESIDPVELSKGIPL